MTKTRVYLKDFLYSLYHFILIYSVILFVSHIVLGIGRLYQPLIMIIPFCIGFIISQGAKNFFVFIGLNLLLTLSFLLIPLELLYKTRAMLFAVFMTLFWVFDRIYSNPKAQGAGSEFYFRRTGYERKSSKTRTLSIGHVVAGGALSFAFILIGSANPILTGQGDLVTADTIKYFFVATTIAMFIVTILQMNMSNLDASLGLAVNSNISSVKKITRFNNAVIIGFAVLAATVIILAVTLHGENVFVYIGQLLLGAIRFIAGLFADPSPPSTAIDMEVTEQASRSGWSAFAVSNESPFILWVVMEKVLFPLAFIFIIAIIISGICYAAYSAYKQFYLERPGEDIKEFIKPDIGLSKIRMPALFSRFTDSWASDNNGKIRKLFYKKITTHIKRGAEIKTTSTPHEIADAIKNREDISALTDIYSKARYSNETVSDSDAAQMLKRR